MPDYVVFTLAGPLASFATVAGNERRGTEPRPGHAMLAGLLSAALGIRRTQAADLSAISDACRFAIRTDKSGQPVTDFHTAQSAKRKKGFTPETRRQMLQDGTRRTIVTRREYLQDIRFTIAVIFQHGEITPAQLKEKLRSPLFTLYLGRKSCPPALPLDPCIIEGASSPEEAFSNYDKLTENRALKLWQANQFYGRSESEYSELAVDARIGERSETHRRERRRVRPVDRNSWRFETLDELVLSAPKAPDGQSPEEN